jgi:hypothetical protein
MATKRYYTCECPKPSHPDTLFDALHEFSVASPKCEVCKATKVLHLDFPFGLGAGLSRCRVLCSLLPRQEPLSWLDDDGQQVKFYPFLVVLEDEHGRGVWLPYWHVKEGNTRQYKYGQWAPNLDLELFESLVEQAVEKGLLNLRLSAVSR